MERFGTWFQEVRLTIARWSSAARQRLLAVILFLWNLLPRWCQRLIVWAYHRLPEKWRAKLARFGSIGFFLYLIGPPIIWVWQLFGGTAEWGNFVQAIISIELSFFLNNALTWPEAKDKPFWQRFGLYHLVKVVTVIINTTTFDVSLDIFGSWLVAYVVATAATTPANFFLLHRVVFREKGPEPVIIEVPRLAWELKDMPKVAVCVPLRRAKYVNQLLRSLRNQDYPNFVVILATTRKDPTWKKIKPEYRLDRKWLIGAKVTIPEGTRGRTTNLLRNGAGELAKRLGCDILFYTDGKIQHPSNWISNGLALMKEFDVDVLAGEMVDEPEPAKNRWEGFLRKFTDQSLMRRNPRFPALRLIDREHFLGESFPITANMAMTTLAFEFAGGFDTRFVISYEDYSMSWRLAAAGYQQAATNRNPVTHKHRANYKDIRKEYNRSGRGAAMLTYLYPECPLGRQRAIQVVGVTTLIGFTGVIGLLSLMTRTPLIVGGYLVMGIMAVLLLGLLNVWKTKLWYAVFFPAMSLFFIFVFSLNYVHQYIFRGDPEKVLQLVLTWMLRSFLLCLAAWLVIHGIG